MIGTEKQKIVVSNLLHPDEETVDEVSWRAGVQWIFVLLDLCHDKVSQEVSISEHSVVGAWQKLHDWGKDVIHLWETVQFHYSQDETFLGKKKNPKCF